jgi:hypothetical protein
VTSIYKGTLTTTADEDTTTWLLVDIGAPHPDRVVVLGVYSGGTGVFTVFVNGDAPSSFSESSFSGVAVFPVPSGTTATIAVTASLSQRKAVSVWVAYPKTAAPLDSGASLATAMSDVTISDVQVQAGGEIFFACSENITAVETFTVAWTGPDSPIIDVNASIESFSSYIMGRVQVTADSELDDLTVSVTNGGAKRLAVVSLESPYVSPITVGQIIARIGSAQATVRVGAASATVRIDESLQATARIGSSRAAIRI